MSMFTMGAAVRVEAGGIERVEKKRRRRRKRRVV